MTRERLLLLLKNIEFSVPTARGEGVFTRDLDECPHCGGTVGGGHYHPLPDGVCELKAAIDWLSLEAKGRYYALPGDKAGTHEAIHGWLLEG